MSYLRIFSSQSEYDSANMPNGSVGLIKENEDDRGSVVWWKDELYEWVDLGLPSGLKWAAWNVGATKPEEFGLYFAWGETQGYTGITDQKQFAWVDYTLCDGTQDNMTKYNATDELTTLEAADDAATATDSSCRMPTEAECRELIDNTTSEWMADYNNTGVAGRIFTSNVNGNSIFVPAAGSLSDGGLQALVGMVGGLWLSSWNSSNVQVAFNLYFNSDVVDVGYNYRNSGRPIRAVKL